MPVTRMRSRIVFIFSCSVRGVVCVVISSVYVLEGPILPVPVYPPLRVPYLVADGILSFERSGSFTINYYDDNIVYV